MTDVLFIKKETLREDVKETRRQGRGESGSIGNVGVLSYPFKRRLTYILSRLTEKLANDDENRIPKLFLH